MVIVCNIQHLKLKDMTNIYVQHENVSILIQVTGIKPGFHLNNETFYTTKELSILSQQSMLSNIRTALIIK